MELKTVSESVYAGLCIQIGTSQQVAARRDVADVKELVINHVNKRQNNLISVMMSGSYREGFRLRGSDVDVMHWPNNYRVLWDFSHIHRYNIRRQVVILCDTSKSPPGFTLLWLPLELACSIVLNACVRIQGMLCISSAKYREITLTFTMPDAVAHGPCSNVKRGPVEIDDAQCFLSDFWPPSASLWIDRCHSWPPPCVVQNIVRGGCHFVAIGHKHGNHVDNEWRISFSRAEQKLVYYMNHTQFLTYGMLKLFLKEIINAGLQDEEKLLCSYHMKTAVFWAIQQNTIPQWCPQNLLAGFWVCFKLILKWVYQGVCPNFFIPENNMFLNKVHGEVQRSLFSRLYGLYEKGIPFLLQSSSISYYIMNVICNPRLSVCTDERALISEVFFDAEIFHETFLSDILAFTDLTCCMEYLQVVEHLIMSHCTEYQAISLQKLTATVLQTIAFILHNTYTTASSVNKHIYVVDKISSYMLKLAAKFGFVSDMLYIAMYYYKTSRHREALSVIEMTKVKLEQPCLMYETQVNPERYIEAVGGKPMSKKMKQAVAHLVALKNWIPYIDELALEQRTCFQQGKLVLHISPFLMLHMLEFLCCRHVDPIREQAALDNLEVLVHHGQGALNDISLEILGICQQVRGNLQAALFSYQQSLSQIPLHRIQTATINRIQEIHLS